jgi:hypothetical protein
MLAIAALARACSFRSWCVDIDVVPDNAIILINTLAFLPLKTFAKKAH